MTRHKQDLKVYADKENHPGFDDLKRTLSRSVTRDNVIDWPLDFAIRSGFEPDSLIGKVVRHAAGVGHKIKDGFNYLVDYEAKRAHKSVKNKSINYDLLKKENPPLGIRLPHRVFRCDAFQSSG